MNWLFDFNYPILKYVSMKLWQKSTEVNKSIEKFTVGKDREMDMLLAEFDVLGSLAHTQMLESIGLLETSELNILHKELKNIYKEIQKGQFTIEDGVEDVHSQVELILTRRLGDVGKKIHSGRSRNDQVLLDLKLYIRDQIRVTVENVKTLFELLISLSEKHKNDLLPGYTHLQIAMPSSFGLWFGAYAESLADDLNMMLAAYKIANKNPLGSAAGYGSSFPLNRQMTTDLLGFESLNYNVVYAQMGRGKTEKNVAAAMSSIASTLGRLAMDVCLYMNQNFGFITFPDELTTGSSIMPHKKNPDVFELIRARCNRIQSLPNEISLVTANLPSGYHRDLQIIKENFLPAFEDLNNCLQIAAYMLGQIKVKSNLLKDDKYKYLFSVEVVNQMVLDGTPFRDAYKQVGALIEENKFKAPETINHTHEGSIGNLMNEEITASFDNIFDQFHFELVEQAYEKLVK
ncbi:argininosuccinate lyase [Sporocytophaga myxococcoides]|uniref:Argininosuccinate lyase n=2 Tax=Sporocytophaga myxococcoides TaxID=153721 RepID=A0A098LAH4_9BACT|nr:argininosuccinate lyase [Sporocytophaga myxococcoides]